MSFRSRIVEVGKVVWTKVRPASIFGRPRKSGSSAGEAPRQLPQTPSSEASVARDVSADHTTADVVGEAERLRLARERFLTNAPAITTGILFALLFVKLSRIARGDLSTALAVLGKVGLMQVIIGSVFAALPFLTVGLAAAVVSIGQRSNLTTAERAWLYSYSGIVILWISFVVSWSQLAMVLGFIALFGFWQVIRKRRGKGSPAAARSWDEIERNPPTDSRLYELLGEVRSVRHAMGIATSNGDLAALRDGREELFKLAKLYNERVSEIGAAQRMPFDVVAATFLLAAISPALLQIFISDRPWMPAEVVRYDVSSVAVGYVLSQDDRWLVLLQESNRTVVSIDSKSIRARSICLPDGSSSAPVKTIYRAREKNDPRYPQCPPVPAIKQTVPPPGPTPTPSGTPGPSSTPSSVNPEPTLTPARRPSG